MENDSPDAEFIPCGHCGNDTEESGEDKNKSKWVYSCKKCKKKTYIEKESGYFQVSVKNTPLTLGKWDFENYELEIFSNVLLERIENLNK